MISISRYRLAGPNLIVFRHILPTQVMWMEIKTKILARFLNKWWMIFKQVCLGSKNIFAYIPSNHGTSMRWDLNFQILQLFFWFIHPMTWQLVVHPNSPIEPNCPPEYTPWPSKTSSASRAVSRTKAHYKDSCHRKPLQRCLMMYV